MNINDVPNEMLTRVFRQLGQSQPQAMPRIFSVSQRLHDLGKRAFIDATLARLGGINHQTIPDPDVRYKAFQKYWNGFFGQRGDYLPESHRLRALIALVKLACFFAYQYFTDAWRVLVAHFDQLTDQDRSTLQPHMDWLASKRELYGDGGVCYQAKTPAW